MNIVERVTKGAAIDLRSAEKRYGNFVALGGVDLEIEAGEFMTFLGPSGSGKTTTLNLVAGFTSLTRGEIRVGGRDVGALPAHKRNFGVVFQHYALFPHMTVATNVAYPLKLRGVSKEERERLVDHVLGMVKLREFKHRFPSELSGGQQQRVAFARAIVFNPKLLLMDEPLGALDKKLREWLQLEIKRIHRELGTTFVYVTHDQEEALILSDRIAVFNKGKIEQVGTGRELYQNPSTLFVGRFIGESSVFRGNSEKRGQSVGIEVGDRVISALGTAASNCAILVRPEHIRLRQGGGDQSENVNSVDGTVSESLYVGDSIKYEVTLRNGTVVLARTPVSDPQYAIGEDVEITWAVKDSRLVRDDASNDPLEF